MNRLLMQGILLTALGLTWPFTPAVAEAYKPETGPYSIAVAEGIEIDAPSENRRVLLRIAYPERGGPFPLVVLSHGGGCIGGSYSAVGDHWASHGYVVIQPTHPDSASLGFDMATVEPRQMEGIIRQRVADMSIVIDQLQAVEQAVPSLADKIDSSRLVAAGHSMGGATALTATGMVLENPFSKQRVESAEDRYDALLLLSEPGHNPTLPEEPWEFINLPTFVYTGTYDRGSESGENSRIPFQYNIVNMRPDPIPPKHHLWVEGVDHFLGGAWCRVARDGSYDSEALDILRGVSTSFLDAYTKDDDEARSFLEAGILPENAGSRPTLSQR
jgi:fermentation-respiration switch protein FrsA (DUF1100 family)